jgi:hypothetical protein
MAARIKCDREPDAFEAASLGWWPDRADDDLRAHVATCESCAEVIAVASALQQDRHEAVQRAPILPAEVVWWRAEWRAREEAARAAARPITVAHVIAVACAGIAALALVGGTFGWLRTWSGWVVGLLPSVADTSTALPDSATLAQWSLPLAVGLGAWLLLAPVALYLTVAKD